MRLESYTMANSATILKDVVGVGNAIVDVITHAGDAFLKKHGIIKGSMNLINSSEVASIYSSMNNSLEMAGGSVSNTMSGIASFGGSGSYIGKVKDDAIGYQFLSSLTQVGITMESTLSTGINPTAQCLVIVTPDGERSMATYLGACVELHPRDINPDTIRNHQIAYLEGYLWDLPNAKDAMLKVASIAQHSGRMVALTLSDQFCVRRHRESFLKLIRDHVDILFANEEELFALYETTNLSSAINQVRSDSKQAAITMGAKGSIIVSQEGNCQIDAIPIQKVIDGTGAGDMYAAGVLFGITHGYELKTCGHIGSLAAQEILGHLGARPQSELYNLLSKVQEI